LEDILNDEFEAIVRGIGRDQTSAIDELYELLYFFNKAFVPGVSEKDDADRFDMTHLLHDIPQSGNKYQILDVCCGSCLALKSLISQHHESCGDFNRIIKYVGVDWVENPLWGTYERETSNRLSDGCNCFERPLLVGGVDITDIDTFNSRLLSKINRHNISYGDMFQIDNKFDKIFLTNTLHEIPPIKQIDLLSYLSSLLNVDGELIIIDTDVSWCHANNPNKQDHEQPKHWSANIKDLSKSEWEVLAVRYRGYDKTMREVLEAIGLENVSCNEHHHKNGILICKGKKNVEKVIDKNTLKAKIKAANAAHSPVDGKSINKLRQEIINEFEACNVTKAKPGITLIPKIMQYFCLTSSIYYRNEKLQEINCEE